MFDEILEELLQLQQKIELMDDPTDDDNIRKQIGKAHYALEMCINKIEEI